MFKVGELVQWVNSDGHLYIDLIRKNPNNGKLFFWNIDFDVEAYDGIEKLDVSVPYFDDETIFVDV